MRDSLMKLIIGLFVMLRVVIIFAECVQEHAVMLV